MAVLTRILTAAILIATVSCSDSPSSSEGSSDGNSSGEGNLSDTEGGSSEGEISSSVDPTALADTSSTGDFVVFVNCGDRERIIPNDQQKITLNCSLKHPAIIGKSALVTIEVSDEGIPEGWSYALSVDNVRYSGEEITVTMTESPSLDLVVTSVTPATAQLDVVATVVNVNEADQSLTVPFRIKRIAD